MSGKSKNEDSSISIIDAVETLSNIADLEFDRDIGIAQIHEMIIQGQKVSYRTVHWLHQKGADETVDLVRDIFRVVLHYLKNFYKKEYGYITDQKTMDGIKTIMVLVGEAAKKLDKYTDFFKDRNITSVMELREYKQLQEFYHKKIDRRIDEGVLGRWILALENRKITRVKPLKAIGRKMGQTKHVFVDLDSVKKDVEYELFFMRKEDGSRFFSPRLIRNIKLVCDFGDYFTTKKEENVLENIEYWSDKYSQITAKNILGLLNNHLEKFYKEAFKIKDNELIDDLKMCFMALYLGANTSNLAEYNPIKKCSEYLSDFQFFLRRAINTRDYQKLVAYPPKKTNRVGNILLNLVRNLCQILFVHLQGYGDLIPVLEEIIQKSRLIYGKNPGESKNKHSVWSRLAYDYSAMNKAFKLHPNGPIIKVLDLLQDAGHIEFDTLMQGNIPTHWFDITFKDKKIAHERIPCPTRQEFIQKAYVTDEFKEFLRSYREQEKRHLVFNLQDRTTWREHFRSTVLEDLQDHPDFKKELDVVTLAIDTEFYHQVAPYHLVNHADIFIEQLKDHVRDESAGYYFPQKIKKKLFSEVDGIIESIHRVFFNNRNVLLREARMDFIQIFYMCLQLKILEICSPDSFSSSCKDGVDIAPANTAQLFAFLKLVNQEVLSEEDHRYMNWILYSSPVLIRERVLVPDRFNRMVSALKVIEAKRDEVGFERFSKLIKTDLGKHFESPLLEASVKIPKKVAA